MYITANTGLWTDAVAGVHIEVNALRKASVSASQTASLRAL